MKRKILFLIAVFTLAFVSNVFAKDIPELPKIPEDIKIGAKWKEIENKYKGNLLSSKRSFAGFSPFEFIFGIKYDDKDLYANIAVYTDIVKAKIIGIDYTLFYREKDFQSNKKEIQKAFNNLKKEYCKEFGIPDGSRSFSNRSFFVQVMNYNTDTTYSNTNMFSIPIRKYKSVYKGFRFFITNRFNSIYIRSINDMIENGDKHNLELINILDDEDEEE